MINKKNIDKIQSFTLQLADRKIKYIYHCELEVEGLQKLYLFRKHRNKLATIGMGYQTDSAKKKLMFINLMIDEPFPVYLPLKCITELSYKNNKPCNIKQK
jgi:hypothetical protein